MTEDAKTIRSEDLALRPYRREDQGSVRRLFDEGRLAGQQMPNDTAADIDNIEQAYLQPERGAFWVAEHEGRVVGMVGVAEEEKHLAEIRRLRVDPAYRGHGIAFRLLEQALHFCRRQGYLKVVIDTGIEQGPTMEVFEQLAFQHNRTKTVGGKELLEYYLDLYREPAQED